MKSYVERAGAGLLHGVSKLLCSGLLTSRLDNDFLKKGDDHDTYSLRLLLSELNI